MKIQYIICLCLCLGLGSLNAQTRVVPAEAQSEPILLKGVTAHIGDGTVIENAMIGFNAGKITLVDGVNASVDESGYKVVNLNGKHVYPGFILPNSTVGLREVDAVNAMSDNDEQGVYNPNVRAIIAYNTDSEVIPAIRYNGILMTQSTPTGGVISGSSSIVQLDAWNWEDAAYVTDNAIHLNWPRKQYGPRWWLGETESRPNPNYDKTVQELEQFFKEAKAYSEEDTHEDTNLKLEAMLGLMDGSKALHIHTNSAKSMIYSVNMAKAMGVKNIVIIGGYEAMLIKDFLKHNNIPIVLRDIHTLPGEDHEDTVRPYKLPKELSDAGITYCLGYGNANRARNLPFFAGTTVAYGVDYEKAVHSISGAAANILGIGDRVGTLTKGKDATLFVSEGDALDMRTNKLLHAFIQGREIQLNARQQWLYEKYSKKYGHEIK